MAPHLILAIGSINRATRDYAQAGGEGLSLVTFDETTLHYQTIATDSGIDNPSFLSVDPVSGVIYAVEEVANWHEGTVSALRFSPQTGRLAYLNKQPTLGGIPAHIMLTRDRRFVLVANYGRDDPQGADQVVAVFPVLSEGNLGAACASLNLQNKAGMVKGRQMRPHIHMLHETIEGGAVWLVDLGLDRLMLYRISPSGQLIEQEKLQLHAGAGPRHLAWQNDGRMLYVVNELDCTLSVIQRNAEELTTVQILSTIHRDSPRSIRGRKPSFAAEIQPSPDGHFLYVSNRGEDTIACFAINKTTGLLDWRHSTPSGGRTPRHFGLTPTGRHLLVAHQNSSDIVIFRRDKQTGALISTGQGIPVANAVCVQPFMMRGKQ